LTKVYCITQGETTAATDPKQESTADESACDQPPPHHSAVVQTQLGPVSGTPPHDDSVEVFKGIPFAAPPVGDLRWRAPQPAAKWSDVRVCDEFAADL
jgi:Carboxylesterase family